MTQLNEAFLDDLAKIGPIGKTLSMLVRPAFVAPEGKKLIWCDFSAIEARVLPWLAASPGADKVLDIFRESDADETLPDIYVRTACDITGDEPRAMWAAYKDKNSAQHQYAKDLRQAQGKVPVLSLGYLGGVGALQAMATNYGVYMDDVLAKSVVDKWRSHNPWAKDFGGYHDRERSSGAWGAINRAIENPGDAFPAGRSAFVYDPSYLGGTLFAALPCGRLMTYPDIRWRTRTFKDKNTQEDVEKHALWFKKGYGWSALWQGRVLENLTQGAAGSILRETLVYIEELLADPDRLRAVLGGPIPNDPNWMLIVSPGNEDEQSAHTHDEIVCEIVEGYEEQAKRVLLHAMSEWRPAWRADLPLVAECSPAWSWYTKAV